MRLLGYAVFITGIVIMLGGDGSKGAGFMIVGVLLVTFSPSAKK